MVQIIQSGPSQATLRQQALDQAMGNISSGIAGIQQQNKVAEETKRQQALKALDTSLQLRGQGYDVTPEQVAQLQSNPQAGFGGIFDKRTAQYTTEQAATTAKAERERLAFEADLAKKQAEAQSLLEEAPTKKKKQELEIKKLENETLLSPITRRKAQAEAMKSEAEAKKIANEISTKAAYGAGKQISAKDVATFQEGNQIPTMLADVKTVLEANKNIFDPIKGRIASLNPYNEQVQTVESQIRTASQAFGKYMEGGVLRPDDEAKYRKMFPNLTDTPEIAKNKLQIVNKILTDRQKGTLDALEKSGYNIGGIRKEFPQTQLPTAITGGVPQVKAMTREEKIRLLQGGA